MDQKEQQLKNLKEICALGTEIIAIRTDGRTTDEFRFHDL